MYNNLIFNYNRLKFFKYKNIHFKILKNFYPNFLKNLGNLKFFIWQKKISKFYVGFLENLGNKQLICFNFEIFLLSIRRCFHFFSKIALGIVNRFCFINTNFKFFSMLFNLFSWYNSLSFNGFWFRGLALIPFFHFYTRLKRIFSFSKISPDLFDFLKKNNLFLKKVQWA